MLAVFINVAAVLLGSALGLLFGSRIKENYTQGIMMAIALCTFVIGVQSAVQTSNILIVMICLAIGTTVEEVQYLLKYAGQAPLYVRRRRDVIIWFGFMKHMSLDRVDEKLRERELKPLIRSL